MVYASKMALLFENNEKVFSTTLVVVWEFAAKSEMARRFVTLGPPRGCPTVRGGQRGGGSPPRGVRGAASATEGAGPEAGRDALPAAC